MMNITRHRLETLIAAACFTLMLIAALPGPVFSQEQSADEVAKELANPNSSLASLTFKNQFHWYTGDLPGADEQSNYTLLFQPVFPFPMKPTSGGGKANLFFRPAFPFLVDQPVPQVEDGDVSYGDVSALGDIGFDLAYGLTKPSGFLWVLGMDGTLPTATDSDVAGKQWRLGAEGLIAKTYNWGLWGIFPSHQWNVAGWSDTPYSMSQLQLFLKFLPGNGWSVGTTPIMNYDWETEQWTIPLNLGVSKTVMFGTMPVKLEVEGNYYVEQPDAFGPEWMFGVNITPVVPNVFATWLGLQ